MFEKLFATMVVGSMPRPQFFREMVDRYLSDGESNQVLQNLMDRSIPYVAALQEAAGLDVISDGEWRRKSYIGVIADMVTGFELEKVAVESYRHGAYVGYAVTGPVTPVNPGLFAREAQFLRKHTDREIRVAIPTPYHLGVVHWDRERSVAAYPNQRDFVEVLIPIIRQEVIAMRDAGVRYIQFDDTTIGRISDAIRIKGVEPIDNPTGELAYAVDSLNRTIDGIDGIHLSLHLCGKRNLTLTGDETGYDRLLPGISDLKFDMLMFELSEATDRDLAMLEALPQHMEIGVGCVHSKKEGIDTPEQIAQRVRRVLEVVDPHRIAMHPDCGFSPGAYWDIPLDEAYQKLHNEVLAADMLRREYE